MGDRSTTIRTPRWVPQERTITESMPRLGKLTVGGVVVFAAKSTGALAPRRTYQSPGKSLMKVSRRLVQPFKLAVAGLMMFAMPRTVTTLRMRQPMLSASMVSTPMTGNGTVSCATPVASTVTAAPRRRRQVAGRFERNTAD